MSEADKIRNLLKTGPVYAQCHPLEKPEANNLDEIVDMKYLHNGKWFTENIPTREEICRDNLPIPSDKNREGYNAGYPFAYWLGGLNAFRQMRILTRPFVNSGRVLDFGGSSGRVARHFAFQEDNWEPWLCDFKPSSVQFVQNHFRGKVKAFTNTAYPSLPIPDGFFDLITCFSVFTHINEAEIPWLLELLRTLRPGGVLYITIHDELTWERMENNLLQTVERHLPEIDPKAAMPPGKTVATWRHDDPYNCNVFHALDYIENVWGSFATILDKQSAVHVIQGAVVLQRRA